MPISATTSTRRLSHSPSTTDGSDDQATAGEKKVSCTRGQPGVCVMPYPTAPAKTRVDSAATAVERRARDLR